MATTKVTVTLPGEQLAAIRELVADGRAASVSGFVQHAVGVALDDAAGWQLTLDVALATTGGWLTEADRAWADQVLGLTPPGPAPV